MKRLLLALLGIATGFAQPGADKASIQGVVVDATDGKPVAGATVFLEIPFRWARSELRRTTSNAQGKFSLRGVDPANTYYLTATADGYLRNPGTWKPSPFWIAAGENWTGIVLRITRAAMIRGTIMDADGDLVPGAAIAMWRWQFGRGVRYLAPEVVFFGAGARADGSFVIGNVEPGTIYLGASRRWEDGDFGPPRTDTTLPAFSPQAAELSSAKAFEIVPGAKLDGVEVRLRRGTLYSLRGTARSAAAGLTQLVLCPVEGRQFCHRASRLYPDGRFAFDNIPGGEYEIYRDWQSSRAVGRRTVAGNVADLAVELQHSAAELTAAVHGAAASLLNGTFSLDDLRQDGSYSLLKRTPEGAFAGDVALGTYRLLPKYFPEDLYIESVRSGARDVTYSSFELTPPGLTLDITVRTGAARVSGSVTIPESSVSSAVPVTIWASGPPGFSATVTANESGEFQFVNVPPGKYRIAAWDGTPEGMAEYPPFYRSFPDALELDLAPGSHRQLELTAIPEAAAGRQAARFR